MFDKVMKLRIGESFCQLVRNYLEVWSVLEVDLPSSHCVTNLVILDVNMLCSSVIDKIISKGDGSLIVVLERDGGIC